MSKSFVTVTAVFFASSLALAQTPFSKTKSARAFAGKLKSQATMQDHHAQCVDFSGVWKGQCTEVQDGVEIKREETMTIEQFGCESIDVAGDLVAFGGSNTSTSVSPSNTYTTYVALDWNQQKTGFTAEYSLRARSLSDSAVGYRTIANGLVFYNFEDGKITTADTQSSISNFTNNSKNSIDSSSTTNCTFTRVK